MGAGTKGIQEESISQLILEDRALQMRKNYEAGISGYRNRNKRYESTRVTVYTQKNYKPLIMELEVECRKR